MAKITITLYGKEYNVNCSEGEEARLKEIANYVEGKMNDVAGKVGNATESRLLMLTCLHLADELFDARRRAAAAAIEGEDLLVAAVEHLSDRVAHIATQVGRA